MFQGVMEQFHRKHFHQKTLKSCFTWSTTYSYTKKIIPFLLHWKNCMLEFFIHVSFIKYTWRLYQVLNLLAFSDFLLKELANKIKPVSQLILSLLSYPGPQWSPEHDGFIRFYYDHTVKVWKSIIWRKFCISVTSNIYFCLN